MKRIICTSLAIMCVFSFALAQPIDSLWSRTYGGANSEYCYSAIQTFDGGYALAGRTSSFGAGSSDFWLVKVNAQGDSTWSQTYGGINHDQCQSVIQTADGGYMLAGYTSSFGAGDNDFWLVRTNSNGDSIWSRTYGSTLSDACMSIQPTSDGSYILAGHRFITDPNNVDIWMLKIDTNGDIIWDKMYGGGGGEFCQSVRQTTDGGYIIAAETWSYGVGHWDNYVIKTDAQGDTLWTRTFGYGGPDWGRAIEETTEGNYILLGTISSGVSAPHDTWLIKLDSNGDSLWSRILGGIEDNVGLQMCLMGDSGIAVAGYTDLNVSNGYDFWLLYTDENGNNPVSMTFGGMNDEECASLFVSQYRSPVLAGMSQSYGAGGEDFWLVKTGPEYPCPTPLDTDPFTVMHLRCNEGTGGTAFDETDYHNDASLNGYVDWLSYGCGTSLDMTSHDAFGEAPDNDVLDIMGPLTIEAWVYPTEEISETGGLICGKRGDTQQTDYCYALSYCMNSGPDLKGLTFFLGGTQQVEGEWTHTVFGDTLPLGVWSHVAGVYDGSMMYLFIDGELRGTNEVTFTVDTSDYSFRIGKGGEGWAGNFPGYIDEIRVSNIPRYIDACYLAGPLEGTIGPGTCHVANHISVEAGDTLIIQPGTTLDFLGPYTFAIEGYLEAIGTEQDSIKFTCDTLAVPERWWSIRFLDSADDNSKLSYCLIENSAAQESSEPYHDGGGILCLYASPTIEHSEICYNFAWDDAGGIKCNHASPTISDCWIHHNNSRNGGGGMAVSFESHPQLTNCIFEYNSDILPTGGGGGGVIVTFNSNPAFYNCDFMHNDVFDAFGGGVRIAESSHPTFSHCNITNNTAEKHGGGVYCENSLSTFDSCTISSNSTDQTGGGFYNATSRCKLTDCDFTNNTALTAGGLYSIDTDSTLLSDCTISGNSATGGSGIGAGGGIYFYSTGVASFARLDNCVITGNHSAGNGGGGIVCHTTQLEINSCTISDNTTTGQGGGIWYESTSGSEVNSSIVWGNCASVSQDQIYMLSVGDGVDFACCDIDTFGNGVSESDDWDADCIFLDPLFCNPALCTSAPTTEGDYTINLCSPCSDLFSDCGLIGALDIGCGADPAPVEDLVITEEFPDAELIWTKVTTTTCGAPQEVDYYLVYFESENLEDWDFLGYTADTTFTHHGVVQFSDEMFYMVEAYIGSIGALESIPENAKLNRNEIRALLTNK